MSLKHFRGTAYAYRHFSQMPEEPQGVPIMRNARLRFWSWIHAYANRRLLDLAVKPRAPKFYRFPAQDSPAATIGLRRVH